jgi:hypothetical protein
LIAAFIASLGCSMFIFAFRTARFFLISQSKINVYPTVELTLGIYELRRATAFTLETRVGLRSKGPVRLSSFSF